VFFLDYAPVIFTSAQSGFNLDRLLEAVRYVAAFVVYWFSAFYSVCG